MAAEELIVQPAPGWITGTCWCGCGFKISNHKGRRFLNRDHRSKPAPDGRMIREWKTKWCQTCQTRFPLKDFPTRTVRQKTGYVTKPGFYCQNCLVNHLRKIRENLPKEVEAARARARYADPIQREVIKARNRERLARNMRDPVKREYIRSQKAAQRRRMIAELKQRQEYDTYREQENVRMWARRAELRDDKLDANPLVVPKGHPMVEWMYGQIDQYCEDRGLSALEIFGSAMGGRNWMKWRSTSTANGGAYISMRIVDAVLTRLDLPHRLDDFPFQTRQEWRRQTKDESSRAA